MPITKSAIKHLRQTKEKTAKNISIKKNLEYLDRKVKKAIEGGKIDEAKDWVQKALKAFDKAAQKRVIKENTAARKKSRLMKFLNKAVKK